MVRCFYVHLKIYIPSSPRPSGNRCRQGTALLSLTKGAGRIRVCVTLRPVSFLPRRFSHDLLQRMGNSAAKTERCRHHRRRASQRRNPSVLPSAVALSRIRNRPPVGKLSAFGGKTQSTPSFTLPFFTTPKLCFIFTRFAASDPRMVSPNQRPGFASDRSARPRQCGHQRTLYRRQYAISAAFGRTRQWRQ